MFKDGDDPEKRAALLSEVTSMTRGMAITWDQREDQLVRAVEEGKYLWVEVDLEHYLDAAKGCLVELQESPENAPLRRSLQAEIEALRRRAGGAGIVHDRQMAAPSGLLTTPQY